MRPGYFFSDEPGYYEPGVGGVRLETILMTVVLKSCDGQNSKNCDLKYGNKNYGTFLGFEPVCLVPFEPKLINYTLLSDAHIDWLNYYNQLIRTKVGTELKKQGKTKAWEWMEARTDPIIINNSREARLTISSSPIMQYSTALLMTTISLFVLLLL